MISQLPQDERAEIFRRANERRVPMLLASLPGWLGGDRSSLAYGLRHYSQETALPTLRDRLNYMYSEHPTRMNAMDVYSALGSPVNVATAAIRRFALPRQVTDEEMNRIGIRSMAAAGADAAVRRAGGEQDPFAGPVRDNLRYILEPLTGSGADQERLTSLAQRTYAAHATNPLATAARRQLAEIAPRMPRFTAGHVIDQAVRYPAPDIIREPSYSVLGGEDEYSSGRGITVPMQWDVHNMSRQQPLLTPIDRYLYNYNRTLSQNPPRQ